MIEQQQYATLPPFRRGVEDLQRQILHQRQRYERERKFRTQIYEIGKLVVTSPFRAIHRLPTRYLLHAVVTLMIPAALVLSRIPTHEHQDQKEVTPWFTNVPTTIAPGCCGVGAEAYQRLPVGDPPLRASDDIPMPVSLVSPADALAPIVVPATIAVEKARLRSGPGVEYDELIQVTKHMPLQVIGRFQEWFRVRVGEGQPTYWIPGELLAIPQAAAQVLLEVSASDIPAPPPPKLAMVKEDRINFRDGPGTNYVSMGTLQLGEQVTLLERYQDWFHVLYGENDGWVRADFLEIGPGILNRVPITTDIPDPNPALVANVTENAVNLRQGPGTIYPAIGRVNADTVVDLLAKHKEWFKVKLQNGTQAWIFSELLQMSPMVRRRVPDTNDIPAPPRPQYIAATRASYQSRAAAAGRSQATAAIAAPAPIVDIPANGDVASYAAQFVGSRYVYGGSSPSGFDCSGFVKYVYGQYGVHLPHNAAAQYSTAYGSMVGGMNNLAPGDLMFFAGTYGRGISHVAIYLGGGQMVHAMTPQLGVQVSNIWDGYWTSHYYGALRVQP